MQTHAPESPTRERGFGRVDSISSKRAIALFAVAVSATALVKTGSMVLSHDSASTVLAPKPSLTRRATFSADVRKGGRNKRRAFSLCRSGDDRIPSCLPRASRPPLAHSSEHCHVAR